MLSTLVATNLQELYATISTIIKDFSFMAAQQDNRYRTKLALRSTKLTDAAYQYGIYIRLSHL